jgi:hypothetical protein
VEGVKVTLQRPKFLHGTLKDVVNGSSREILLYLSGDDEISREFESGMLT